MASKYAIQSILENRPLDMPDDRRRCPFGFGSVGKCAVSTRSLPGCRGRSPQNVVVTGSESQRRTGIARPLPSSGGRAASPGMEATRADA
jgi:hypothetical protein